MNEYKRQLPERPEANAERRRWEPADYAAFDKIAVLVQDDVSSHVDPTTARWLCEATLVTVSTLLRKNGHVHLPGIGHLEFGERLARFYPYPSEEWL
jgi:hypothetical protein